MPVSERRLQEIYAEAEQNASWLGPEDDFNPYDCVEDEDLADLEDLRVLIGERKQIRRVKC